jgi:MFS family permease
MPDRHGRLARRGEAPRVRVRQIPGAPALLLAVGIARLGVPALSLAMLLAARESSGGYGTAGAVGAAYALAVAGFQLGWGRAADRGGAAGIVRITALSHAAALALFAALAQAGTGEALIGAAALAGACFPPVATVSRAAWRQVEGEDERRALFALDGVTTEVTLIAGPLLATALVAIAGAPAAVIVVAAMVAAAALAAATSPLLPRGREDTPEEASPPIAARRDGGDRLGALRCLVPRSAAGGLGAVWRRVSRGGAGRLDGGGGRRRDAARGLSPALVALLVAAVAMAGALGALTVASVAFAEDASLPSGLPLTVMAAGGVAGALAWGARSLPVGRRAQLAGGLVLYAVVVLAATVAGTAATLALLVAAGALMAPCDALQAQLCGEFAPPTRAAESFAWLNSANWVGFAAGTSLGGAVVDAAGPAGGFTLCAVAAATAATIAAGRRLKVG